jgi:hypothetical protein
MNALGDKSAPKDREERQNPFFIWIKSQFVCVPDEND